MSLFSSFIIHHSSFLLKHLQRVVHYPNESEQNRSDHHPAHGQVPALPAKNIHRDEVERYGNDYAGAFPEIRGEAFAACAAKIRQQFEKVKDQHCADSGQDQAKEQTDPYLVLSEHNV